MTERRDSELPFWIFLATITVVTAIVTYLVYRGR